MRLSLLPRLTYAPLRALCNAAIGVFLLVTPVAAAPITLLAFGDSLTEGYGLPPEDGFVPQLQAWLAAHGQDVAVVNGGVSGDTTAGGKSRLDWSLTPDIKAMIVNFGGNDLLRGIDPATSRANLTAIIEGARARGVKVLLVREVAPGNYGADYKTAFDSIFPDLAAQYGVILSEPYFTPLIDPATGMGKPDLVQPDGIHPNAAGVAAILDVLGPKVLDLLAQVSS